MKRSFQQISRLARPTVLSTSRPAVRSLATVSSSIPLGNSTSLPIEVEAAETTVVTPSSDMVGFELSAGESSQATDKSRENLGRPIYLDAQATTPTDPRVLDAMLPYMTNQYGNPHSKTHAYGWETEKAVDEGRKVSSHSPSPRRALRRYVHHANVHSRESSTLRISSEQTRKISSSLREPPNPTTWLLRVSLVSTRERRSTCE